MVTPRTILLSLHHLMNCPATARTETHWRGRGAYQQKPVLVRIPFGKRSNPLLFCSNFLLASSELIYHCRRKQLFQLFEKGINKPLLTYSPRCHCCCTDAHNLTCEKRASPSRFLYHDQKRCSQRNPPMLQVLVRNVVIR